MKVKRIVFINRAPFRNLDIDFLDSQVVSLTGINGAGKTTLLSYPESRITDTKNQFKAPNFKTYS